MDAATLVIVSSFLAFEYFAGRLKAREDTSQEAENRSKRAPYRLQDLDEDLVRPIVITEEVIEDTMQRVTPCSGLSEIHNAVKIAKSENRAIVPRQTISGRCQSNPFSTSASSNSGRNSINTWLRPASSKAAQDRRGIEPEMTLRRMRTALQVECYANDLCTECHRGSSQKDEDEPKMPGDSSDENESGDWEDAEEGGTDERRSVDDEGVCGNNGSHDGDDEATEDEEDDEEVEIWVIQKRICFAWGG